MGKTKSNRRLLPGFLSPKSGKKSSAQSVVSTTGTASLTLATDDSDRLMGVDDLMSTHSANSISYRSMGFSRSASYLMRRALSNKRGIEAEIIEKDESSSIHSSASSDDDSGTHFDARDGRVDDIFSSELNRCSTSSMHQLRLERDLHPIVCYESDDGESQDDSCLESHPSGVDAAIDGRLEALKIQERLLGKEHTDVIFLSKRTQRLRGQSELLRSSLERSSVASRAHYYPKSALMMVPLDYPMQ